MKKRRTLYEGPEWDECRRRVTKDAARFDEQFRFIAENISMNPRENTRPFLTERNRVLETHKYPSAPKLYIYFEVSEDDDSCELLWIEYPRIY